MVVPDEEFIEGLQMEQQVESGAYATDDYDFKNPSGDLTSLTVKTLPFPNGDKEIFDWPGGYVQGKWGAQYATTRIEELQQPKELVTAQSTVRGLAPGYLFTLERCPRRDQNREYLILAVTALVRNNPYHTGTGRPAEWHFSFVAQPSSTTYRPVRMTPKPQVAGPQTAIVVGLKGQDEEIVCDKYGRVRVQFHWDRHHKNDQESSCWIRVATMWAGNNWGHISIPRVGQEVIVDFLDGDPDYPIITGRVYNGEQMPPWDLPGKKTQSGILTRSTKKGAKKLANMIRMEDDKGNEELHVHAQRNLVTVVESDEIRQVGANRHVQIEKDHIERIKGAMELRVDKNQDICIDAKKTETIGGDNDFRVKGARKEKVDGDQSLTVGGDQQEKVGNKHAVDSGMEIHLKAGMKVIIEAGMQLSLKAAGGFIDIGPTGVSISGTMVLINSGGSAGSGGGSSPASPSDAKKAEPSGPTEE
jgi:type VI secretion system secreted protein VgrG